MYSWKQKITSPVVKTIRCSRTYLWHIIGNCESLLLPSLLLSASRDRGDLLHIPSANLSFDIQPNIITLCWVAFSICTSFVCGSKGLKLLLSLCECDLCIINTHFVSALSEAQGDATGMRDSPQCCACGEARYKMVFQGLWSKQTHPKGFPTGRGEFSFQIIVITLKPP